MTLEVGLSITLTVAAIVATIVTAWMAVETRRMARVAADALALERAPVLGFRDLRVELGVTGAPVGASPPPAIPVRIGVELFNAGRVPVRYKLRSFNVTLSGRTTDSPSFISRGGRVLPGSSTIFWHSSIPLDPPLTTFPATGRACVEFEYSDESGSDPKTISELVEYRVDGSAPGSRISWLNIDEPAAA